TMLATVWPARSTLTFDATGRAAPGPHTVTKPAADASVAVTLSTAPEAPAATGPRSTSVVVPPARAAPERVSSTRVGPVGWRRPLVTVALAAGCQAPMTSTTRWVAACVNTSTAPPSPTGTITRFGIV